MTKETTIERESCVPFALRGLKVPRIHPEIGGGKGTVVEDMYDASTQTLTRDFWMMGGTSVSRHTTTLVSGCDNKTVND